MAKNSADSIKATQDEMRQDQRAWLGIGSAEFVINATTLKAEFTAMNVGKSPAIRVFSNVAWAGKLKSQVFTKEDIVYPVRSLDGGTVFPNQNFKISNHLPEPLSAYQATYVDELIKGDQVLYVFAKIEYRDVFDRSHFTHYCVIVSRDLKSNSPCSIYNDSDPGDIPKKNQLQNPN